MRAGNVLVIGDDPCSCLTIVRSLGRQGLRVVLGTQNPQSLPAYSRYVSAVIPFPPYAARLDDWWNKLEEVLRDERFDLVIPASDGGLVPIALNRRRFEPLAKLAVPDEFAFEHTYRKDKTLAMASELGVPLPRGILVGDRAGLSSLPQSGLALPVVVKPVSSKIWRDGKRMDKSVRLARSWDGAASYAAELIEVGGAIIQNTFRGIGVGQEFLADGGEILTALQHERVHEPLGGGGSYYRRTVPLDPEMLRHSRRMLEYMHWTGVAMIEYKLNRETGEFTLIEINGRFWGSLPVAVSAGIDFPADLYHLLVEGRRPERTNYRVNVYSRNVTSDLFWFAENWRADRSNPDLITVPRARAIGEWLNIVLGREHWDTLTLDDPRPGLIDFGRVLRKIGGKLQQKILGRIRSAAARMTVVRRRRERRARALLRERPRILFMCYGNICRSPFAALYAQRMADRLDIAGLQTSSGGTYPKPGRRSPSEAVQAASAVGLDLSAHRSRVADDALIDSAGLIFCMDLHNYGELRRTWPRAAGRIFLLGSFDPQGGALEIADPWGGQASAFQHCYGRISRSLDEFFRTVILPWHQGSRLTAVQSVLTGAPR
jgi:protein-tyrosine-phosphatase